MSATLSIEAPLRLPVRLTPGRRRAAWASLAAAAALCAACYAWVDVPLYLHTRAWHEGWAAGAAKAIARGGQSHYYLVPAALVWLAARRRRPMLAGGAAFLFLAVAATGLASIAVKCLLGRYRPEMLLEHDLYGFSFFKWTADYLSFPSGHTTTAFAVATALLLLHPRIGWIAYLPAVAVAAARVLGGAHFLGDVIAGAWLGALGTLLLAHLLQRAGKAPA